MSTQLTVYLHATGTKEDTDGDRGIVWVRILAVRALIVRRYLQQLLQALSVDLAHVHRLCSQICCWLRFGALDQSAMLAQQVRKFEAHAKFAVEWIGEQFVGRSGRFKGGGLSFLQKINTQTITRKMTNLRG